MMKAAVENGADAVYFGLQEFNARLRANNFTTAELPNTMSWLHERGVKGYITLNTLIFSGEMEDATRVLLACSAAGVDAVLVQDLGLAALAARLVPDLPVHASTQMTLTSAESIEGAEALGLKLERVVAAREASLKELRTLRRGTSKEIEVFVHGAICVAYSGQCLTSEALGGRSANRGECAQACRLPYDMIVDGEQRDMGDVKYLLSPKDLAAYEDIGQLMRAGIVSLKIEGRLKSPQYVAATVQSYRAAVDHVWNNQADDPVLDMPTREKLEMTFSRGFTGGYLHATDHQAVVEGRFPKKRGLYLGRIVHIGKIGVTLDLEAPLKLGDGVVFDSGHPDRDEEGGRVYGLEVQGSRGAGAKVDRVDANPGMAQRVEVRFGSGHVALRRVQPGDRLWKTSDPAMDRALSASYEGDQTRFQRSVVMEVTGRVGERLRLQVRDEEGVQVEVQDSAPAEHAQNRPLTREVLEQQLGRLGGTPFTLRELRAELSGDLLVPFSRLNELRRRAVEGLVAQRRSIGRTRRTTPGALRALREELCAGEGGATTAQASRLSVLCRTLDQVRAAAAEPGVGTIYTDFEDIRLHREARALIPAGGPRFVPATLRVIKPGEAPFVRKLLEADPDAVLVRNLAAWHVLRAAAPHLPLLGDYALNVANHLTAGLLMKNGLERLTPSYDLNIDQLADLLQSAPADWFEVTIHQHLPMFHMEHCVFCRFLTSGTDFTNCGRPCETHTLELKDRMGYKHPVKADAGCRNTVYNAIAQSGSEYLDRLLAAGVRHYRIELIQESPEAVVDAIRAYLPAIRGEADGRKLWRRLHASSKLGVTRGSLDQD